MHFSIQCGTKINVNSARVKCLLCNERNTMHSDYTEYSIFKQLRQMIWNPEQTSPSASCFTSFLVVKHKVLELLQLSVSIFGLNPILLQFLLPHTNPLCWNHLDLPPIMTGLSSTKRYEERCGWLEHEHLKRVLNINLPKLNLYYSESCSLNLGTLRTICVWEKQVSE